MKSSAKNPVQGCPNKKKTSPSKNPEKKSIRFKIQNEDGDAVPNVKFTVVLPDQSYVEACTDEKGMVEINNIDPGNCKIETEWRKLTVDKTALVTRV